MSALISAVIEPTLGRQKNKNQNQYTKNVPLPGCARISPKDRFLCCVEYKTHRFGCRPRDYYWTPPVCRANLVPSQDNISPVGIWIDSSQLQTVAAAQTMWPSRIWI